MVATTVAKRFAAALAAAAALAFAAGTAAAADPSAYAERDGGKTVTVMAGESVKVACEDPRLGAKVRSSDAGVAKAGRPYGGGWFALTAKKPGTCVVTETLRGVELKKTKVRVVPAKKRPTRKTLLLSGSKYRFEVPSTALWSAKTKSAYVRLDWKLSRKKGKSATISTRGAGVVVVTAKTAKKKYAFVVVSWAEIRDSRREQALPPEEREARVRAVLEAVARRGGG